VPSMLDTLEAAPGPLPLLQFTAAKLWENRDRSRRVLTKQAYAAMGEVAGALATHADEVLASFAATDQKLVRAMFQRLVTPERTRAIVDVADLRDLSSEVDRILGMLVAARLIVVHTRGEGPGEEATPAVELVHESLVKSWPTLQRWLDESQEDAAFISQLRAASKQWDAKGRVDGLLWRNEAMDEARLWRARYRGELPPREQAFLDAVFALANRAARSKRRLIVGAFVFLIGLVIIGGVALFRIRTAEQFANDKAAALENTIKERDQKELRAKEAEQKQKVAEEEQKRADAAKLAAEAERAKADAAKVAAEAETVKVSAKSKQLVSAKELADQRAAAAAAKAAALAKDKQKTDAVTDQRKSKISTGGLK